MLRRLEEKVGGAHYVPAEGGGYWRRLFILKPDEYSTAKKILSEGGFEEFKDYMPVQFTTKNWILLIRADKEQVLKKKLSEHKD